jgi:hypothetical protein
MKAELEAQQNLERTRMEKLVREFEGAREREIYVYIRREKEGERVKERRTRERGRVRERGKEIGGGDEEG